MNTWQEWAEQATGNAGAPEISAAIGDTAARSTIYRWLNGALPPADAVVKIARAYDADPLEALIAAGYLQSDDIHAADTIAALNNADSLQLIEELLRRALTGTLSTSRPPAITESDAGERNEL